MPVSQTLLFTISIIASAVFLLMIFLVPFPSAVKVIFAVLALLCDVIGFSTKYYSYIFVPFAHMKGRTVVINDQEPFIMSPSGNAILVRKDDAVFASAFVKIPSYRSATEMTDEEKVDFARLFSRVLSLAKTPVKFSTQLYVINKDTYIGNIRSKLNDAEEKYQAVMADKAAAKNQTERVKGEVTMWHNLYDNVSKTKSQALEAYAMVTAQGGTDEEATNLALQQADEMAAGVSAVFGISAGVAGGDELLKFIEPDSMMPVVTISEQIRENTLSGEM